MDIIVSAKNFELTPSLRTYVEEKLGRLQKFWSRMVRVRAELSVSRHHKHGDVNEIHVWIELPGSDAHLSTTGPEMHAVIDEAYARLERLVQRAKGRASRR